jgi:hypothetical protein
MFIPLTINQRREGLPNVLIAGDTAGIFYLLSHLTALELNIFLADTGIRRPLREFPCHRGASKDRANVYYDFFDGKIGAGVVRRMDAALTTSCDLKKWTRGFRVPALHLWQDASGTWLEFEGVRPEVEKNAIGDLLTGFIKKSGGRYKCASSQALLDRDGAIHDFPAVEQWEGKKLIPEESGFSAWDRASDVLADGGWLVLEDGVLDKSEERRLLEIGIPELDVVLMERFGVKKYVELTGDLARVFDGLF